MKQKPAVAVLFGALLFLLAACTSPRPAAQTDPANGKLNAVATTTIVGDVVAQIGGENLNLVTLLPAGADPHSFQPTPQDIARVADADLVFINGLGLEEFLEALIENAGGEARVISVSDGIEPLEGSEEHEGEESDPEHEDEDHEHEGQDPHVWTDPNNVQVWAENIAAALSEADPQNSAVYESNAQAYRRQLQELDGWIRAQVAEVPESSRKLVSDHSVFAYFAARYGFELIGAVIPSYSTLAEPSARELAALEDSVRSQGVKAIFVGETVNPTLSRRVAEDTGLQLVSVLTGSLTGPEGHAPTYLDFIRYNVTAITSALK